MKKVLILLTIVFTYNFANSQCNNWEFYSEGNGGLPAGTSYLNQIKVNPITGDKYAFANMDVLRFNGTTWTNLITLVDAPNDIEFDYMDTMYLGTLQGLRLFDGSSISNWYQENSLFMNGSGMVVDMCFDSQGGFWVVSGASKMATSIQRFYNGNVYDFDSSTPGLGIDMADIVSADNFGNVFLASGSSTGFFMYNIMTQTWSAVSSINTTTVNLVSEFAVDDSGYIYINFQDTLSNNLLYKYDGNGNWSEIDLTSANVNSFYNVTIAKGNIWFNNAQELYHVTPTDSVYRYDGISPNGYGFNTINDLEYDKEGYLFMSTDSGIFKINLLSSLTAIALHNSLPLTDTDIAVGLYSKIIDANSGQDSLIGNLAYIPGAFNIMDLYPDSVYLRAFIVSGSSYTGVLSNSYYANNDTTYEWQEATFMDLSYCINDTVTINIYEMSTMTPGAGNISGNIKYGASGGTKAQGEPVPGIQVLVEQEPNDDPVAYATSDSNGDYSFANTAEIMNFHLVVDIPGIPQIETYNMQFTNTNHTADDLNFIVDTTGVYIDSTVSLKPFETDLFSIKIYPNPSTTYFNIDYKINQDSKVSYKILDSKGSTITVSEEENKKQGNYNINIANLESGIYFIQFRVNNTFYSRKIVIN